MEMKPPEWARYLRDKELKDIGLRLCGYRLTLLCCLCRRGIFIDALPFGGHNIGCADAIGGVVHLHGRRIVDVDIVAKEGLSRRGRDSGRVGHLRLAARGRII